MPNPKKISAWINAFIPEEIPGLTSKITAGPHNGKTAIPGVPLLSGCFLTDQRTFDADKSASSRMQCAFVLDVDGDNLSLTQTHKCDPTTEVDCDDGVVGCTAEGSTADMTFILDSSTITNGKARIHLNAAASNPCLSNSPPIDFLGIFEIDFDNRRLTYAGAVEKFPGYEGYVSIDDSDPTQLFQIGPKEGADPFGLFAGPSRAVNGTVRFPLNFSGKSRVDKLFNGDPDAIPLRRGETDTAAVGVIQGLLIGHGYRRLPNVRGRSYGKFGPLTERTVRAFQKRFGLGVDGIVGHQTLRRLVIEPASHPIASEGYVSLALKFTYSGFVKLVSFVSLVEGAGKFAALNRNTDKAGLSFGIIQWAQRVGRLEEIVEAFKSKNEALFHQTFGGSTKAEGMLTHVKKANGGVHPRGHAQAGETTDPNFDLIKAPWTTRFIKAGRDPVFRKVQINIAVQAFTDSFTFLRTYDTAPVLKSERAVAFALDMANQFGNGQLKGFYEAVSGGTLSESALMDQLTIKAHERMDELFPTDPRFAEASDDRRQFFIDTMLLTNDDFTP